jgi:two-component system, chemotaxis family, CheB/CheR fusion protein
MKSAPLRSPNVPQRKELTPSNLDFPVVGIGASAGGLQAVKSFFEHMPKDCGMAFVVILHLSPDHQSVADKIIQESTGMPVTQVNSTMAIRGGDATEVAGAVAQCPSDHPAHRQ